MSRARATALTLVNWKGVFFERYLLDRHVTALEGANGAGKTTVMIAAYVVLLPDLTRLKFTNLGETGATGGDRGIWGRLGELGPSYAALEIELGDGQRVLAGVYLERKAAPALSLTPFVLSGWAPPLSPQRFFLRDLGSHEQVQTLADLAQSAEQAQATLEVFSSSKDYFAHLFERGINPLRLSTDEERNKFNDMLRTSMTGGISRTLTSDLRSFLFKQQTGLFDTLSRMRKNLEACRRTRLEVSEARVLEHEINGIYAAGHAMFSSALAASRGQAAESRRELEQRAQERTEELARAEELETELSEIALRKDSLGQRASRARDAEALARERLFGMTRALAAAERLRTIEREYARVQPEAELTLASKAEANAAREKAKRERDEQQQTLLRAAAGLASLQAGLEELHRQAHAFRRVHAQLGTAQGKLEQFLAAPGVEAAGSEETILALRRFAVALQAASGARTVSAPSGTYAELSPLLATGLQRVNQARDELDRARAERDRRAEVAARRRQDHAEAEAALAVITGGPVEVDLAARAREELGRLSQLTLLGSRVAELSAEWQHEAERAERQRALKAEVRALGLDPLPSARELVMCSSVLDAKLRACELRQREHELAVRQSAEREQTLRGVEQAALGREEGYRQLAPSAARLEARAEGLPKTRAQLNSRLRANDDARRDVQTERARVAAERQAATSLALEHEMSGGGPQADLVRIAELIDGQMLAGRYEDLEVEPARRAEAELGPLVNAIVVEEPARALPQVLLQMHAHESIWLLRARAEWPLAAVEATAAEAPSAEPSNAREPPTASVVVDLGYGFRVTRLPRTVRLGRAARRRQIERLRAEAEAASRALTALDTSLRENDAARRDLEALQEHWEVWTAGDPATELERVRGELAALEVERTAERQLTRELRVDAARLAAELAALKAQLGDHHLLDPPDYGPRADRARETLDRAKGAVVELARVEDARRTLEALVHGLGDAPPGPEEVEAWRLEQPLLEAQRDRLFAVAEALAAVDEHRAAWAWADAERALGERTELVPELEAQHSRALVELGRGLAAVAAAEAAWEATTGRAHEVTARLSAIEAHLDRAREELRAEGVQDPSSEALEHAQQEAERLGEAQAKLRAEESAIDADLALCRERLVEAQKRAQQAELELRSERDRAQPADRQWQLLSEAARAAGVLEAAEDAAGTLEGKAPSSQQRWLEAQAKMQLLGDRLAAARGGAELARDISAAATQSQHGATQPERGTRYLELWLLVRAWLLRRLPTPVAELGEPLLGLARLGADLTELGGRLERQEGDLRGTSGDVARSIDVQVRQATAQLRRLNQSLVGVSFGSIHGIRVQMERVEKMDQVLSALRDGETQELLFQSNLPIEEALDEIFRRHAGGRTGGQRLVDYREYLDLHVQIQRRPEQGWERVNPSQVSTGEAIGIGAALMMVILAEWERDDQLLRRERRVGSLRFLFLDEANRLSQDNLGVLFDLCQALDLQLLIAAPEVARAEGNTTYRLVRRVSDDGREEVLVTGRRATLPAEPVPESREVEHAAVKSEQLALLGT